MLCVKCGGQQAQRLSCWGWTISCALPNDIWQKAAWVWGTTVDCRNLADACCQSG